MRETWWLTGWAAVLVVLLLGPALAPGYVLSYDMVWVPDLTLGRDALGTGSALPRAVPSDAVIAVLDEVVPSMLLQKVVLTVPLAAGAVGAAKLVPDLSLTARLGVVTLWIWNPFVVERLAIGHWPVLIGYSVLPWLVLLAGRAGIGSRPHPWLPVLVVFGSLSPSSGLATAFVVLAFGARRGMRQVLLLLVLLTVANLPWIASGLLHVDVATTGGAGADLFALTSPGSLPAPLAALGLGGIWNLEVVPSSRTGVLAWGLLAMVLALALLGVRRWWHATERRERAGLLLCWVVGWGVAVLPWLLPGPMEWFVEHVPGAGLLRDSSRLLGMCAPLLVVLAGHGMQVLLDRAAGAARLGVAVAVVLLPVALLPDASGGAGGHLVASSYPGEYDELRDAIGDARGHEVLVLPFSSYRAPEWNEGRKVLDPMGRYLEAEALVADTLVVSGREVAGEDPRAQAATNALELPEPAAHARELARLGVGVVVVEHDALGDAPAVEGDPVHDGEQFSAVRLDGVDTSEVPARWRVVMGAAWTVYGGLAVISLILIGRRGWERCYSSVRT